MSNSDPGNRHKDEIADIVGRKARRKQAARETGRHSVWFGFGMFGLVGWAIAVPTIAGAMFGVWLDHHAPQAFSWTLTLLIVGLTIGCLNAWWWVNREGHEK
jgi:ATP synthase protein I